MKLLEQKVLKDCFDGSMLRELVLNEPVQEDFIQYLGRFGALCYYSHFERPFFQLKSEGFQIKGIRGNDTITATLFEDPEASLRTIEGIIERFRSL